MADGDLVDVAAAWHRVASWVLAQQQATLVGAAYRDADHPGRRLPDPAMDVADNHHPNPSDNELPIFPPEPKLEPEPPPPPDPYPTDPPF